MKRAIVLAMHGSPPTDFPRREVAELMGLHGRLEAADGDERAALQRRHDALEARMRAWPRDADNDPYWAGSMALAEALRRASDLPVVVGFNEFCGPSLEEAIRMAAGGGAEEIIVATPMMTRGGGHAERDIPAAIARAAASLPEIRVLYAWPFDIDALAAFLWDQVCAYLA